MKMETVVAAPCAGVVSAVQAARTPATPWAPARCVAVIAPGGAGANGSAGAGRQRDRDDTWAPVLDEVQHPAGPRPGPPRPPARTTPAWCASAAGASSPAASGSPCCSTTAPSARWAAWPASPPTTTTGRSPPSPRPTTWAAGARIEGRPAIVCADDFTSRGGHADGAIGAKSCYLDRLSIELRAPSVRLLDGSSGGGSVAAMVPEQKKDGDSTAKESSGAITAGRPRVAGGGGSFLPGHLGQHDVHRAAGHRARGQPAAGQRGRHRRGQGRARPLLGHGARHRPAVRGRPPGGEPRHGLRHHQGGPGRLAHPLPQRVGGQPGRDRGGGGRDGPPLPVLPALQRVRGAAGAAAPDPGPGPTAATRSCSPSSPASGPPPSTCAGPSS